MEHENQPTANSSSDSILSKVVWIARSASLRYNQTMQWLGYWAKHSQIVSGLFLGVIPTNATAMGDGFCDTPQEIIDFIKQTNPTRSLCLVVSVVERCELEKDSFLGVSTVTPDQWKRAGMEHLLVEMQDFTANLNNKEEAITALFKMKKAIDSGNSVYVHCKAGRSRSAMLCAIYLAAFVINPETKKNYTLPEAIQTIKNARKQTKIEENKVAMATEILKEIHVQLGHQKPNNVLEQSTPNTLTDALNSMLTQSSVKHEVLNLTETYHLKAYAASAEKSHWFLSCYRSKLISELGERAIDSKPPVLDLFQEECAVSILRFSS